MALLSKAKGAALGALAYLGDAAHRRFVATIAALLATHMLGKAFDADQLALYLEIGIGGLSGAWSSRTPQLDGEQSNG